MSRFFIVSLCCFIGAQTFSQRIDSILSLYANRFPQERMYIHFDRKAYATGETVWFKAYFMACNAPSDVSKNAYTDWYDGNGNLIAHSVFPIVQGTAAGMFVIPDSLKGNAVHVKAYTTWMLNWDTSFLYEKTIPVIEKKPSETIAVATFLPSLHFFPEGGDIVEGLPSRIAFAATDQYGKPVKINGVVTSNTGDVIDAIKTEHDGMGSLPIVYKNGETYTANWRDEQNAIHKTTLPSAMHSGVAMEIVSSSRKKIFVIRRSETVTDNLKQLHIVGTMNQQPVYVAKINLTETNVMSGSVSTDSLATGILQITLFSNDWKPIAERICYVKKDDAIISPDVNFKDLNLNKRGKNSIDITMPDSMNGNLSLAVTDEAIEADSSNNIVSRLLLTGDIKGAVYKPQYYFSNNSDSVARHLDLVMLTHGWRRYNWQAIVRGEMPVLQYPAEQDYLVFSGKINGANNKQLHTPGSIYAVLQATDSSQQIVSTDIKPDGTFKDLSILLFDSTKILFRFSNKAFAYLNEIQFFDNFFAAKKHVDFDTSGTDSADTTGNAGMRYLIGEQTRLNELLKGTTLQNVTVTTQALSSIVKLEKKYTKGVFRAGDAFQFDLTNNPVNNLYRNVFDYLNNKVGSVRVGPSKEGISVFWKDIEPALYLDEEPVDVHVLYNLSVADIAYVKAYPEFIGNYGGKGKAIAIYTRKGSDRPIQPGMFFRTVAGYKLVKEFYSPDYSIGNADNQSEDVRSTLYWNPMIVTTPENRKLNFTFYNNDVTKVYRLILEGITSEGKLIHVEKVVDSFHK